MADSEKRAGKAGSRRSPHLVRKLAAADYAATRETLELSVFVYRACLEAAYWRTDRQALNRLVLCLDLGKERTLEILENGLRAADLARHVRPRPRRVRSGRSGGVLQNQASESGTQR